MDKPIPVYCENHPDRVAVVYTFGEHSLCQECYDDELYQRKQKEEETAKRVKKGDKVF